MREVKQRGDENGGGEEEGWGGWGRRVEEKGDSGNRKTWGLGIEGEERSDEMEGEKRGNRKEGEK
jgi:hypothetical protein